MVLALGGRVEAAESGEFGRTELRPARRRRPPARRPAGGAELLDEPPRRGLRGARGVHGARLQPELAGRRLRAARPRPLRDPVPPRGRPHALRDRDPHPLPARRRRLRAAVVAAVGDRRAGREDPGPGRRGPGDLRPLRRRRLLGRGAARPQGGGGAADLRLRRPRPDAAERGRAGGRGLRPVRHPAGPRRRRRALPRQAGRAVDDPERKRKIIGERVHPRLRGGGGEARGRRLPGPGHALLGRDRVRRLRPRGDDQVPPQRRRPARRPRVRAGRAAADAVQGRGARGRRRARPARADGLAPALPGARAWRSGSSAARSTKSGSTSSAPPTRSCRRRSAPPSSTASSGSPSACCRWSARSASRATAAPTPTRS